MEKAPKEPSPLFLTAAGTKGVSGESITGASASASRQLVVVLFITHVKRKSVLKKGEQI